MNARTQFLEQHGEHRRWLLAAVVALGVHLAFLLVSTSPRQTRVALAAARDELDVRLQEEAEPAPGAPGANAGDPEADAEEPPAPSCRASRWGRESQTGSREARSTRGRQRGSERHRA